MAAFKNKTYQERYEKGLCIRCGEPAVTKTLCESHRIEHLNREKSRQKQNIKLGLCRFCDSQVVPGKLMCDRHLKYYRLNFLKHSHDRKNNGYCLKCNRKAIPGRSLCGEHLEKLRKRYLLNKTYWEKRYAMIRLYGEVKEGGK